MFSLNCGFNVELILNSACFATKPFSKLYNDSSLDAYVVINDMCHYPVSDTYLDSQGNYAFSSFDLDENSEDSWYVIKDFILSAYLYFIDYVTCAPT